MKYKVFIQYRQSVESFDAIYVSYNEHNILTFKTEDNLDHETSLPWYYEQVKP